MYESFPLGCHKVHFLKCRILFVFDKNEGSGRSHRRSKVAPPRLGGQRVGVFGTRSPHRPNPLGLTLARLDRVEGSVMLPQYVALTISSLHSIRAGMS